MREHGQALHDPAWAAAKRMSYRVSSRGNTGRRGLATARSEMAEILGILRSELDGYRRSRLVHALRAVIADNRLLLVEAMGAITGDDQNIDRPIIAAVIDIIREDEIVLSNAETDMMVETLGKLRNSTMRAYFARGIGMALANDGDGQKAFAVIERIRDKWSMPWALYAAKQYLSQVDAGFSEVDCPRNLHQSLPGDEPWLQILRSIEGFTLRGEDQRTKYLMMLQGRSVGVSSIAYSEGKALGPERMAYAMAFKYLAIIKSTVP